MLDAFELVLVRVGLCLGKSSTVRVPEVDTESGGGGGCCGDRACGSRVKYSSNNKE